MWFGYARTFHRNFERDFLYTVNHKNNNSNNDHNYYHYFLIFLQLIRIEN